MGVDLLVCDLMCLHGLLFWFSVRSMDVAHIQLLALLPIVLVFVGLVPSWFVVVWWGVWLPPVLLGWVALPGGVRVLLCLVPL